MTHPSSSALLVATHCTPRDAIRLMVELFEDQALTKPFPVCSMHDATSGTDYMLSVAEGYLPGRNPGAKPPVSGQKPSLEPYATCTADMLIKEQKIEAITLGNIVSPDALASQRLDHAHLDLLLPLRSGKR